MKIHSIYYYLPEKILNNEDLAVVYKDTEWNQKKYYRLTGVRERHIAEHELVSDIAQRACEGLFAECPSYRDKVDFLILCTQSPDFLLPSTSCILQERLGLRQSVGATDITLGCSSFVYGLALAKGLLLSGSSENILLVVADTITKHINEKDKSTRTLFGDGAAATLIHDDSSAGFGIGEFVFGTDGSGAQNLMIPAGGMALPRSLETASETVDESGNVRSLNNLFMDGPAIFNFTLDRIPKAIEETLQKNKLAKEEINLFVFHQANKFMLETLRDKLEIPEERFYINMENKGNTAGASLPIALADALKDGRIQRGDKILLAGFGVGYSWAACVVEW